MKIFITIFIFLSFFIVQSHGATHSLEHDHDTQHEPTHRCVKCKSVSQQPSLVPSSIEFALLRKVIIEIKTLNSSVGLITISNISKSISPRAPPLF